jgi:hypothetical protein
MSGKSRSRFSGKGMRKKRILQAKGSVENTVDGSLARA